MQDDLKGREGEDTWSNTSLKDAIVIQERQGPFSSRGKRDESRGHFKRKTYLHQFSSFEILKPKKYMTIHKNNKTTFVFHHYN